MFDTGLFLIKKTGSGNRLGQLIDYLIYVLCCLLIKLFLIIITGGINPADNGYQLPEAVMDEYQAGNHKKRINHVSWFLRVGQLFHETHHVIT